MSHAITNNSFSAHDFSPIHDPRTTSTETDPPVKEVVTDKLVPLGGDVGDGVDSVFPSDQSAFDALRKLDFNEQLQDVVGRFGRTPSNNKIEGNELAGAVIEAVGDPGNERAELETLQRYNRQHASDLSPSGKRVADVVDKYQAIAAASPNGELSQTQKAALANDLSAAAKPTILEQILKSTEAIRLGSRA